MNTIKLLISVFLFALSMNGWCDEFVVDGIKYSTHEDGISVSVIPNSYTGDIVIPSSVTYNDKSYSVTSIGQWAFAACLGINSVTIPGSVTSIEDDAFTLCYDLTSVTIPNSVTSIGNGSFSMCSGLTNLTIPNNMSSIGDRAFFNCAGITSLAIPSSVTSIGQLAFSGCSGLTSIVVDKENKVYDSRENCNAIIESQNDTLVAGCMNTVIPNSVLSIGDGAFWGCSGLISITIPNSVTSIEPTAFSGCEGLTSITIPGNVTSIGPGAFSGCSGLTSMVVDKENKVYDSRDNCNAIIESQSNTLVAGCVKTVIPNTVTSIGMHSFASCNSLTSITIPNSVTSIEESAFGSCFGLTSITIPNSVTSIGDHAFWDCPVLASVTIPGSVTSIGNLAFEGCRNLRTLVCYIENPLPLDSYVFSFINKSDCVLYVPAGCVDAYKAAIVWNEFENIREIDPTAVDNVADKDINTADAIYNLRGQKVSAGYRGIVIKNGKKVLGSEKLKVKN